MDHIVYVDIKAQEMEKLVAGSKTMIIRGASGRKLPHSRVNPGDSLYFINNNAEGVVKAKSIVKTVFNSNKLTPEESTAVVQQNQKQLQLTGPQFQRWAGKRYLVLIEVENVTKIAPFAIDKSDYGNMDDWLPVEDIARVKIGS
jgi:hypothetical protein